LKNLAAAFVKMYKERSLEGLTTYGIQKITKNLKKQALMWINALPYQAKLQNGVSKLS